MVSHVWRAASLCRQSRVVAQIRFVDSVGVVLTRGRTFRLRPLVLALGLASYATDAWPGEASFDIFLAGIRVGALTLGSEQSGRDYTASGRLTTAGIAGLFNYFFDGEASGSVGRDGTVVPSRFAAISKSPRAFRRTLIEWRDGIPTMATVEPPRATAPAPSEQAGSLDPVSAAYRVLRDAPADAICNATVDIYDGSRRTRMTLSPPMAIPDGLFCAGTYSRLEGEAESIADLSEFSFRVVFRQGRDGLAKLQSIEAPTNFGKAKIERRG